MLGGGLRQPLENISISLKFLWSFKNLSTFATPKKQRGAIAQLVEQRTENPCVLGSIPSGTTNRGEDESFPFFYFLPMAHFVYIIYSPMADKFYVGETTDVIGRLGQHNSGHYHHASTKYANDWEIFFQIECGSRIQALKIEGHIKKMKSRKYYKNLRQYPEMAFKLLEKYSL